MPFDPGHVVRLGSPADGPTGEGSLGPGLSGVTGLTYGAPDPAFSLKTWISGCAPSSNAAEMNTRSVVGSYVTPLTMRLPVSNGVSSVHVAYGRSAHGCVRPCLTRTRSFAS